MERSRTHRAAATLVAVATTLSLAGCTIPFIGVELPFDLPDLSGLSLPGVDLSDLDLPKLTLPIGITTSVEDARQELLEGTSAAVSGDALLTPGTLTVGVKTATSSAPTCLEGDGGSVFGLDVDVAAALASEMGLKVRYVPVIDGTSLGSECDVIMNGKSGNPEAITIAGTYVESATCFFHKGEATVSTATDLNGKSVGVQGGSVSESVLDNTALKMSKKSYVNLNEAFDALSSGEVDYVLCEAYPGAYLATLSQGISFAGALESPTASGVAVAATNEELVSAVKAAFDTTSANGVLDVARTRWVGSLPVLTSDSVIANVPEAASADTDTDASAGSNAITSVG